MSTGKATKQQEAAVIYARVSSEEQVQGYSIQVRSGHAEENTLANHGGQSALLSILKAGEP